MNMERKFVVIIVCLLGLKFSFAQLEDNIDERKFNARGILSSLASGFINRGFISTGTAAGASQIVSLNISNLLVLILLKALVFAATSIGASHFKGGEYREVEHEKLFTDDEILMYLSYLTGSSGCLQKIACQQPEKAKKYAAAGDLLLKASKMFSLKTSLDYDISIQELEQASNVGLAGGSCGSFECTKI